MEWHKQYHKQSMHKPGVLFLGRPPLLFTINDLLLVSEYDLVLSSSLSFFIMVIIFIIVRFWQSICLAI